MPKPNKQLIFDISQRNKWKGATLTRKRKFRRMISMAHHATFTLGKMFPNSIPLMYVLGYPKSGTTWICQLMAGSLGLPFPQHSILPVGFAAVVHGHELVSRKYPTGAYIVRDGRDVAVSSFHHLRGECKSGGSIKAHRDFFNRIDDDATAIDVMPDFLNHLLKHPIHRNCSWGKHVMAFFESKNENFQLVRYEDLNRDTVATMIDLLKRLSGGEVDEELVNATVSRYAFAKQSGREKKDDGQGGSFLRKGSSGDWRNHFNQESVQIFHKHFGKALILAGYEQDDSWVNQF